MSPAVSVPTPLSRPVITQLHYAFSWDDRLPAGRGSRRQADTGSMAERKHGERAPETTSTGRDEDWDGRDLDRERFERVAFVDVDMMELRNTGAVFTECAFKGVRFNASTHSSAAFINCTFTRCAFFDATFTGCKRSEERR